MGPALNIASSSGAYVLTDRGTWLSFKNRGDLAVLVEGDKRLFNQYGVMVVNPAKHPHLKAPSRRSSSTGWSRRPGRRRSPATRSAASSCSSPMPTKCGVVRAVACSHRAGRRRGRRSGAALDGATVRCLPRAACAGRSRRPRRRSRQAKPGTRVALTFGASGLLRDRIAGGESADVFASANMEHPQSLSASSAWGPTRALRAQRAVRARAARPHGDARRRWSTLLDPAIKLGTSTPKADPSGDYALVLFERVERSGAAPAGSPSCWPPRRCS